MRKRTEQSLQAAIKTLRKSISRHQFYIQVSGTEYEVAQRPAKTLEGPGTCGTGQILQDGKCGESPCSWPQTLTPDTGNLVNSSGHPGKTDMWQGRREWSAKEESVGLAVIIAIWRTRPLLWCWARHGLLTVTLEEGTGQQSHRSEACVPRDRTGLALVCSVVQEKEVV